MFLSPVGFGEWQIDVLQTHNIDISSMGKEKFKVSKASYLCEN